MTIFSTGSYFAVSSHIFFSDKLIISCHNGLIKCLKTETGEQLWSYQHSTAKFAGKSQKGYLSLYESKVIAAFKSGEIITLDLEDGRKVYQATNPAFNTLGPIYAKQLTAYLLTEQGIFYQIELDGGKILFTENILPRKLDLVPILSNLSEGFVAHRDEIIKINTELKKVETIFTSKNRIFATMPVFDEKLMYIGTQDGWIYCIHTGSNHEKWRLHVNGELKDDSLLITENSLLVKTGSGSVLRLKKGF